MTFMLVDYVRQQYHYSAQIVKDVENIYIYILICLNMYCFLTTFRTYKSSQIIYISCSATFHS